MPPRHFQYNCCRYFYQAVLKIPKNFLAKPIIVFRDNPETISAVSIPMPILFYGVEPFGMLASRHHSRIRFHFEGTVPRNSDKYRCSKSPCRQSDIAILRTGNCASSAAQDDWKTMQTCRFSTPGLSGRLKQQGLRLSRSAHL